MGKTPDFAHIPAMARQKPPNPLGLTSGFPFHHLWEQFGPEWEKLGDNLLAVKQFETLSELLVLEGGKPPKISTQLIKERLHESGLEQKACESLTDRLYNLAAAYLLPGLQAELGFTPGAFRKELRKLARQADQFIDTYRGLHPLTNIVLWNHDKSRKLDDDARSDHAEQSMAFLEELSAAATYFANEIPNPVYS